MKGVSVMKYGKAQRAPCASNTFGKDGTHIPGGRNMRHITTAII